MSVITAKTAGFCFGVKRAVDKVYDCISSGRKIFTLGPIIHNNEVVKDLESKGVITLNNIDEIEKVKDGVLIIRSHGVSRDVYDLLKKNKIEYIDMTCPFVLRIHDIVYKESENSHIVIAGSQVHPEVVGICGWCLDVPTVIETTEQALDYSLEANDNKGITLVSQTTFNLNKFKEFVEIFKKKGYDVNVVNTICDATQRRQQEAANIASKVDTMIVIGDKSSSNSKKLYDICCEECSDTYFVQKLSELKLDAAQDYKSDKHMFGITAGASTPNKLIEEVQNYVRTNF